MLTSRALRHLLTDITTFRNIGDAWLNTIPTEIRESFYENPYVNSILMEHDTLLKFTLGDLCDDVFWFLYDWKPGFHITVDDRQYIINDLNDYITYLETEKLVATE